MKKQVLGMTAALSALMLALFAGAYAADTSAAELSAANTAYAILYEDGTLVFQNSNTPEAGKTVKNTYEVDLNAVHRNSAPWYNERKSVRVVNFADKISPKVTSYWFYECENLYRVNNIQNLDTSKVTSMRSMFYDCSGLMALDVSHFDTANVTDTSFMFYSCENLYRVNNIQNLDTSKVTSMHSMFNGCGELTALDLSHFDTANVTDMSSMFNGCGELTALDLSYFDTANVTDMSAMFWGCIELTALDVSHFNTTKVTDMSFMFYGCRELTALDVSHFDTTKVTDMSFMFDHCRELTMLDVSHFDTLKVTHMEHMFFGCSNLKTLYASDKFTTSSIPETTDSNSRDMFKNCTSLVGGNGTKYDESHIDKEYARIDIVSAPGYFNAPAPDTPSFDVRRDAYSFSNSMASFGYKSRGGRNGGQYPIPPESLFVIFGETVRAKKLYKNIASSEWGGNCAGMAGSVALFYSDKNTNPADFGKNDVWSLAIGDKNSEITVLRFIEAMQVAQYTDTFGRVRDNNHVFFGQSLNNLYQTVKSNIAKGHTILIAIFKRGVGGHALIAYGVDDIENRICIYDCNYPGEMRYMTLSTDKTVWSYNMGGYYGVWSGADEACSISYIPYTVLEEIWTKRGSLQQTSQLLTVNAENVTITNFDGQTVASLKNGQLVTNEDGVYEVVDLSMNRLKERSIYLPRNEVYTVSTSDDINLTASMTDQHMSAEVTTSANTVTFGVTDDEKENSVIIENALASDTYLISLESDFDDLRFKNVMLSGTGKDADITVSMNQDDGLIFDGNITSLSVDGKSKMYGIASAVADNDNLSIMLTNPNAVTVAVACFNADGRFLSINLCDVPADVGTVIVSVPDNAKTARVMLWDKSRRPLCPAFVTDIR